MSDKLRLRARLAEIGPQWASNIAANSQAVKDAYAAVLAEAPKDGIAVTRDIPYGTHPRQVVDLFVPEGASHAPVIVFVHGGAFIRGDKRTSDQIYDNVLYWFARQGFIGINIEYRQAPESSYPGGAQDVASAMDWVHANVASHGGDPSRILLIGHSAGGTHVATYAFDPVMGEGACRAKAVVLASGRLRADLSPANPNAPGVRAYFGEDESLYEDRSPVTHAHRSSIPVFVVTAEYENPLLDIYGLEFAHRVAKARGTAPRFVQMRGHNHISVMAHFNSGEDLLGRQILEFFGSVR